MVALARKSTLLIILPYATPQPVRPFLLQVYDPTRPPSSSRAAHTQLVSEFANPYSGLSFPLVRPDSYQENRYWVRFSQGCPVSRLRKVYTHSYADTTTTSLAGQGEQKLA